VWGIAEGRRRRDRTTLYIVLATDDRRLVKAFSQFEDAIAWLNERERLDGERRYVLESTTIEGWRL
jgi:hypothetical protein